MVVVHFDISQTCFDEIIMCSIMVGLSPHQISAPRLLVIMRYGELSNAMKNFNLGNGIGTCYDCIIKLVDSSFQDT